MYNIYIDVFMVKVFVPFIKLKLTVNNVKHASKYPYKTVVDNFTKFNCN